jgi:hypothetical protein
VGRGCPPGCPLGAVVSRKGLWAGRTVMTVQGHTEGLKFQLPVSHLSWEERSRKRE